MQRFGTSTILTHEIGRSLLQKDFAKVADLILMPREGGNIKKKCVRENCNTC